MPSRCTYHLLAENLGPPHTQWTHTWRGQARHRREAPLPQRRVPCRYQGPAPGLPGDWRGSIHRQGQDPLAAWRRGADPPPSSLSRPAQSGKWHIDYLLTARTGDSVPPLAYVLQQRLPLFALCASAAAALVDWHRGEDDRTTSQQLLLSTLHDKDTQGGETCREEKWGKNARACVCVCVCRVGRPCQLAAGYLLSDCQW